MADRAAPALEVGTLLGQGRPASGDRSEAGYRGSLVIREKAVQRIAEAAALHVDGVAPAEAGTNAVTSVLGRGYPRVDCDVAGGRVRADVEVIALWPCPAPVVAAAVRAAVTEQLSALAGLRVDAVGVTIAKVVRHQDSRSRVR
ncbi:Asp23/Gls24 family envelope stress response protein [Actinoplanes sp. NPDC051859]|uniref:Asp23/Gls24 family envelope stress response protein n=1 Tax=Actinoplanes sp. NPDC051859 TaxID=3363909 RepID=UPI0037913FDC